MSSAISPDSTPPQPLGLMCQSCGGENTPNSRFCRHCGQAMVAAAPAAPVATAPVHAGEPAPVTPPAPTVQNGVTRQSVVPGGNVDEDRARQLLDRALLLEERGDMQGAILACRQSVSLSPRSAPAYSMLGLLWERTGNIPGAIASYQKVVELAPDSLLERESLQRLRSQQGRNQAGAVFQFDEGELFEGTAPADEADTPDGVTSGTVAAAGVMASEVSPANVATSTVVPNVAQSAPSAARVAARAHGAPVAGAAVPVLLSTPPPVVAPGPPRPRAVAGTLPAIDTVNFTPPDTAPRGFPQWWQTVVRRPSFYLRSLPLLGAAVLSLGFLLWARELAASRNPVVAAPSPTRTTINNVSSTPEDAGVPATVANDPGARAGGTSVGAAPPAGNQTATGGTGSVISNVPPSDISGAGTPQGEENPAPGRSTRNIPSRGRVTAPPMPSPVISSPRRAPAVPVLPSVRGSEGTVRDAESLRGMPAPRIAPSAPRAADPIRIVPPAAPPASTPPVDNGAASPGGAPLSPSGSPGRGYIRILPPRSSMSVAPPPRPSQVARAAERAASAAARSGNADRAIARVTASMEGGDTAWRYQQRGLLFLEKGDNARALDDFNTAIAAYRDRVRRGERVAEAQAGIRACQSGRRTALANMER